MNPKTQNPVGDEIMRERLNALGFKPDMAERAAARLYYYFLERIETKRDRNETEMVTEASAIIRDELRTESVMDLLESQLGFYPKSSPATGPFCLCWFSLNTGPNGECERCGLIPSPARHP